MNPCFTLWLKQQKKTKNLSARLVYGHRGVEGRRITSWKSKKMTLKKNHSKAYFKGNQKGVTPLMDPVALKILPKKTSTTNSIRKIKVKLDKAPLADGFLTEHKKNRLYSLIFTNCLYVGIKAGDLTHKIFKF